MTEPSPTLARLDHLAVLEITGEDRTSWLQGQVTNDVYAFEHAGTMLAFHLDAQGRIQAEIEAVHVGSAWLLLVDASIASDLVRDLDRRVVMEDVAIRILPDHVVYALRGSNPADGVAVARLESDRFGDAFTEIVVPSSASPAIEALARDAGATSVDVATLDARRTLASRLRFGVDFGPTSLPQETGMHRRTVSFTKGCYVGQEPVVMIEHRGKPPRRAVALELPIALPTPFDLTRADGTVAGRCTSLAETPAGGHHGLGIVKRADAVVGAELGAGTVRARISAVLGDDPPST